MLKNRLTDFCLPVARIIEVFLPRLNMNISSRTLYYMISMESSSAVTIPWKQISLSWLNATEIVTESFKEFSVFLICETTKAKSWTLSVAGLNRNFIFPSSVPPNIRTYLIGRGKNKILVTRRLRDLLKKYYFFRFHTPFKNLAADWIKCLKLYPL